MALEAEVLFVNPQYLKRMTSLNNSIEESYIIPSVILAQDVELQQYLGTKLLDKLKAEVKAGTLSGNYETLMDDYVRKMVVWWTMVNLIPSLYVKIDNGGLVIRTADNTSTISVDDLQREVDRARMNAQFYTQRLVDYLCNNSGLFPEYSQNTGSDMLPQLQAYSQNGLTISGSAPNDLVRYLYS